MEKSSTTIIGGLMAGFGGIYGKLVGLNYKIFIVLLILMLCDVIMGVIFSFINGEFETKVMKKGMLLKMLLLILLLCLVLFQIVLDEYNISAPFSNIVTGVLAFMEMASIVEHFAENGVLVPQFIVNWFAKGKIEVSEGSSPIKPDSK